MKKNSLADGNPELAKEWHPTLNGDLTPEDVTLGSGKKVWWQCGEGHEWDAVVYDRNKGNGCTYCSNQKILPGYNDLATTNPELAKEWHPTLNLNLTANDVFAGSSMKAWWKCSKGHEWQASICNRNDGNGCSYCSGRCAIKGVNDLETINHTLAEEWHPTRNSNLTPSDVLPSSNKKVWWICMKGHEWQAIIGNRSKGRGCPYCSNREVLGGYNDLATTNPELAKEWHPIKNGNLTPDSVTSGTNQKVWWQCNERQEHEWIATIGSRNHGNGCPYCSNNKVLTDYNDLATKYPELAKEWNHFKNGDLTPFDVSASSNKKAWWQCRKGHEWEAIIGNRSKGRGCPKCNLGTQTSFPEQAIHYYLKQAIPVGVESRASVFGVEVDIFIPSWNIGIEYDGLRFHNSDKSIARENKKNKILSENGITLIRIKESKRLFSNGYNAIYCVPDSQYYYLKSTLAALAEMLFEVNGTPITLDINIDRDRIKVMEQYVENEKERSLAICNPTLATEWHPTKNGRINPDQVASCSAQKVWWQCEIGHEWQSSIRGRNKGSRCPYCSDKKIIVGFNDLSNKNPELAKEWHPTLNNNRTPYDVTWNSGEKVWWRCSRNEKHCWRAKVNDRNGGSDCPYCSNRKVLVGYNDLTTTNPKLAKEWHPIKNGELSPCDVTAGSDKKIWWQCGKQKTHCWDACVYKRTEGNGCPYCAGKKISQGNNDLATTHPQLAREWHPTKNGNLTSSSVISGSSKKVWWQCTTHKDHQWEAPINRRSNGSGCPYCVNQKTLPGYNDLATTNPDLAAEWHPSLNADLTPSDVVAGSNKKVWWQCPQNHKWNKAISARNNGYGRCPECAKLAKRNAKNL